MDTQRAAVVTYRGKAIENTHVADVAVVDARGRLLARFGNPFRMTLARSAAKPAQALSVIETGAPERFGFDDAPDPVRMTRGEPHADRAAEIVHHEREAIEVECEHEALEVVDMVLQPVAAILRRRAFAESHVIGHDDAVRRTQRRNQMAEQVTPRRFAMQAQNGFAVVRAFVHVVHPEAGCVVEMRGERKGAVERGIGPDHRTLLR